MNLLTTRLMIWSYASKLITEYGFPNLNKLIINNAHVFVYVYDC